MGPECYRHFIHLQRRAWDAAETESAESPSSALGPNADYSKTTQGHRSWTCGDSARRLRDTGRSGDLCGKSTCQTILNVTPSSGRIRKNCVAQDRVMGSKGSAPLDVVQPPRDRARRFNMPEGG